MQVKYIRENREKVLEGLIVRNIKQPELVDEIIVVDDKSIEETVNDILNLLA